MEKKIINTRNIVIGISVLQKGMNLKEVKQIGKVCS